MNNTKTKRIEEFLKSWNATLLFFSGFHNIPHIVLQDFMLDAEGLLKMAIRDEESWEEGKNL